MEPRVSAQTLAALSAFLQMPQEWRYGYDLSRHTGLKSGTLYPILMRLAANKLLETRWESSVPGKPPRHMYKLTAAGLRFARQHVTSTSKLILRTKFGSTGS
jgi:PadR family transcriptional regulator, regulatory protein PadR